MTLPHAALRNQLLAALPKAEWLRWMPELEPVKLPLGEVLYESGGKTPYVYFPTNAIVSLLYVLEDGASAEIAVVGFEGVVGISIFMGGAPRRAGPWCKARARAFGCGPTWSRTSSRARARSCT